MCGVMCVLGVFFQHSLHCRGHKVFRTKDLRSGDSMPSMYNRVKSSKNKNSLFYTNVLKLYWNIVHFHNIFHESIYRTVDSMLLSNVWPFWSADRDMLLVKGYYIEWLWSIIHLYIYGVATNQDVTNQVVLLFITLGYS